jgi:hypothetical protein
MAKLDNFADPHIDHAISSLKEDEGKKDQESE